MNLNISEINTEQILNLIREVANKVKLYNKSFTVGGKIVPDSESFFKKLSLADINVIETRRVAFDYNLISTNNIYNRAILKALEFEYYCLDSYAPKNNSVKKRLQYLKNFR